MSDAVSQAHNLVQRGDALAAADVLNRAQQAGNAMAARELALWFLAGQVIRRSLASSRAMFERAADLGDDYSAAVTRAFLAGGVGGAADWSRAVELLRDAAASEPAAAAQLCLIDAMDLTADGAPAAENAAETLSEAPEVRRFPALFSGDECAYLIDAAKPLLQPSVVVDPRTGQQVPNPVRTSSAAGFPFIDENPAIHALNRRLAAASGTDVRSGEPLQVLHYAPGQQYHPHSDALPNVAPNQQRVLTFLVWLNDDFDGGETSFPHLGLSVRGRTGDGLLFRNALPDGTVDPRALHAGLPVTRGVKHIASRWIRAAPLVLE